ncbi:hypothetical protein QE152_g5923 [Popillia japonica]|uniref:Uncharacterized protein n=1 Tax=Popillia japonica TaxID=7064 RepID=A0AAW1MM41_POPJA
MEKDEENYKKLKSKKSFELSSEGGSVHDGSILSMQTPSRPPPSSCQKPETDTESANTKPTSQTYTVLTEHIPDTRIDELIQNLSMAGDTAVPIQE